MVVSSEIPTSLQVRFENKVASFWMHSLIRPMTTFSSVDFPFSGSGNSLVFSKILYAFKPSIRSKVASPPSSTITSGPLPSGKVNALRVHSQYSLKDSPFQAKTAADLLAAIAAAAWS